jgi:hypothetical protein
MNNTIMSKNEKCKIKNKTKIIELGEDTVSEDNKPKIKKTKKE